MPVERSHISSWQWIESLMDTLKSGQKELCSNNLKLYLTPFLGKNWTITKWDLNSPALCYNLGFLIITSTSWLSKQCYLNLGQTFSPMLSTQSVNGSFFRKSINPPQTSHTAPIRPHMNIKHRVNSFNCLILFIEFI